MLEEEAIWKIFQVPKFLYPEKSWHSLAPNICSWSGWKY